MSRSKKKSDYIYNEPIEFSFSWDSVYEEAAESWAEAAKDDPEGMLPGYEPGMSDAEVEGLIEKALQSGNVDLSMEAQVLWEQYTEEISEIITEADERASDEDKASYWVGDVGQHQHFLASPSLSSWEDVMKMYYERFRSIDSFETIEVNYDPKKPWMSISIGRYFYIELLVQGTAGYREIVKDAVDEEVYGLEEDSGWYRWAEELSDGVHNYWLKEELTAYLSDDEDEEVEVEDADLADVKEFVTTAFKDWLVPNDLVVVEESSWRYGFTITELQVWKVPPPKSVMKAFAKMHGLAKVPPVRKK